MSESTITVLYFAAASTSIGLTSEQITLPIQSLSNESKPPKYLLSSLPSLIISLHPDAPDLKNILEGSQWSVDVEMVDNDNLDKIELKGGEEVGVICPVSGG